MVRSLQEGLNTFFGYIPQLIGAIIILIVGYIVAKLLEAVVAGGGALLSGLEERLRRETGILVHVAEVPLACVAKGSGRFLEEIGHYQGTLSSQRL
jgi:actin-like ATPase involved in cell morphogenesis